MIAKQVKCSRCNEDIPPTASYCPNCGTSVRPASPLRKGDGLKMVLAFLVLILIMSFINGISSKHSKKPALEPSTTPFEQSTPDTTTEVSSITVRGEKISVYDTADQVFAIVSKDDLTSQTVQQDPNNPNSSLVVKNYTVEGRRFSLHMARVEDPGPYRVIKIITR